MQSGSEIPPVLFFLVRIALEIREAFWFQVNHCIFCSIYLKKFDSILMGIALNKQKVLGRSVILMMVFLLIQKHRISFLM